MKISLIVIGKETDLNSLPQELSMILEMVGASPEGSYIAKPLDEVQPNELGKKLDQCMRKGNLHEVFFIVGEQQYSLKEIVGRGEVMSTLDPEMKKLLELYAEIPAMGF